MSEDAAFTPLGEWRDPGAYRGALVLLTDLDGRVGLQFRDRGAPIHPGRWGFFGGGVEPGESLNQAAARELAEETGLRAQPDAFAPFIRLLSETTRGRLYIFRLQMAVAPEDIRLGEGGGFGFFETEDWRALALVPFARKVLERHAELGGA